MDRRSALSRRHVVLTGGVGLVAGLGLAGAWPRADRSGALVVAVPTDPVSIDPGTNSAELVGSEIILNIFDTLVAWAAPSFQVLEGRLAQSWSISPDGRTYVFQLRQGVRFHDGATFDAAAVKFSFERTHALNAYMRTSFDAIESITVEAPDRVAIRLSRSEPFFLSLLAQPQAAIVSPDAVKRLGKAFGDAPVGTGAFRFLSREPDVGIVLDGNPDYFRGPPKFKHIVFSIVADVSTRRFQLENGDIDVSQQSGQLASLPMEDLKAFRRNRAIQVIETPSQIMRQLEFNNSRVDSPIHDIRVRRAMSYAIDYDGLIDGVLAGSVDRAYGPLPTSNWAFDPAMAREAFHYDPARARQILHDAGYDAKALTFEIYTFLGTFWATVATFLQSNLAAIGMTVRIRQVEFPSLRALHLAGQFEMALDGRTPWYNDPDAHITIGYLSTMARTAMTFRMPKDDALDGLILRAQTAMDPEVRRGLYADVQHELMARIPAIYLFSNKVIVFARADVRGLQIGGAPPLTEYWGVYKAGAPAAVQTMGDRS